MDDDQFNTDFYTFQLIFNKLNSNYKVYKPQMFVNINMEFAETILKNSMYNNYPLVNSPNYYDIDDMNKYISFYNYTSRINIKNNNEYFIVNTDNTDNTDNSFPFSNVTTITNFFSEIDISFNKTNNTIIFSGIDNIKTKIINYYYKQTFFEETYNVFRSINSETCVSVILTNNPPTQNNNLFNINYNYFINNFSNYINEYTSTCKDSFIIDADKLSSIKYIYLNLVEKSNTTNIYFSEFNINNVLSFSPIKLTTMNYVISGNYNKPIKLLSTDANMVILNYMFADKLLKDNESIQLCMWLYLNKDNDFGIKFSLTLNTLGLYSYTTSTSINPGSYNIVKQQSFSKPESFNKTVPNFDGWISICQVHETQNINNKTLVINSYYDINAINNYNDRINFNVKLSDIIKGFNFKFDGLMSDLIFTNFIFYKFKKSSDCDINLIFNRYKYNIYNPKALYNKDLNITEDYYDSLKNQFKNKISKMPERLQINNTAYEIIFYIGYPKFSLNKYNQNSYDIYFKLDGSFLLNLLRQKQTNYKNSYSLGVIINAKDGTKLKQQFDINPRINQEFKLDNIDKKYNLIYIYISNYKENSIYLTYDITSLLSTNYIPDKFKSDNYFFRTYHYTESTTSNRIGKKSILYDKTKVTEKCIKLIINYGLTPTSQFSKNYKYNYLTNIDDTTKATPYFDYSSGKLIQSIYHPIIPKNFDYFYYFLSLKTIEYDYFDNVHQYYPSSITANSSSPDACSSEKPISSNLNIFYKNLEISLSKTVLDNSINIYIQVNSPETYLTNLSYNFKYKTVSELGNLQDTLKFYSNYMGNIDGVDVFTLINSESNNIYFVDYLYSVDNGKLIIELYCKILTYLNIIIYYNFFS
jgi:hypothetical protein